MSPAVIKTDQRVTLAFWSITLIGGGVWLLLINFNLLERFEPTAQYILAGVLGILGIGFFGAFLAGREKWWRLIPGWLLLTLAVMVLLSARPILPDAPSDAADRLVAAVLFCGMAIAFLHVFLLRRKIYWWAIIPSGFMAVLAGVVAASIVISRLETLGALLSVGMGLVFVLLYFAARAEQGWWPLIPAMVLILFGIAAFTSGSQVQNVVLNLWPVLLILCGIFLARLAWSRDARGARPDRLEIHSAGPGAPEGTPRRTHPARPTQATSRATDVTYTNESDPEIEGVLGAYSGPAPGASVEVLDDGAEENNMAEKSTAKRAPETMPDAQHRQSGQSKPNKEAP